MKVAFVYCIEESLGVEYLSAVLKQAGHETHLIFDPRLFDFNHKAYTNRFLAAAFDFREYLLHDLDDLSPDLVAFSANSPNYQWTNEFARQVKKRLGVPIVYGGLHPTFVPEKVMENDFVDYMIRGEGEYPLLELVESLERGSPDYSIANLWARSPHGIVRNPLRPLIADLDTLPYPDKDLFFQHGPPFTVAHMTMAGRGCTYACSFCGNNPLRKVYFGEKNMMDPSFLRFRSVGNVIGELVEAKNKFGISVVRFNDDDLACNEDWLREFSLRYPREVGLPYKCFVNPLSINERTTEYLAESGCDQIQMGVQSLNPEMRKLLGRPMPTDAITKAIRLITQRGIPLLTDNIFGLPGEQRKDFDDTIQYYMENPVDFINVFWLTYFPKADIINDAKTAGLLTDADVAHIEYHPFQGTIQNKTSMHKSDGAPFQMKIEVINYFPRWMARLILTLGLDRIFLAWNIFPYIKAIRILMPKTADHVPRPNEGYDIFALRYGRLVSHYMKVKVRKVLRGAWSRLWPKSS